MKNIIMVVVACSALLIATMISIGADENVVELRRELLDLEGKQCKQF